MIVKTKGLLMGDKMGNLAQKPGRQSKMCLVPLTVRRAPVNQALPDVLRSLVMAEGAVDFQIGKTQTEQEGEEQVAITILLYLFIIQYSAIFFFWGICFCSDGSKSL